MTSDPHDQAEPRREVDDVLHLVSELAAPAGPVAAHCQEDRRRPFREDAQRRLKSVTLADRVALVAYFAAMDPEAFLQVLDLYEAL